jgi:hypothetical protein
MDVAAAMLLSISPWRLAVRRGLDGDLVTTIALLAVTFALGLMIVVAGAYYVFDQRVTLFDPTTGAMWH